MNDIDIETSVRHCPRCGRPTGSVGPRFAWRTWLALWPVLLMLRAVFGWPVCEGCAGSDRPGDGWETSPYA
jgi:hypothetical protein